MEWEFKITTMDQKTRFIYLFKSRGKVIFVTKFVILGKHFPLSEVLCIDRMQQFWGGWVNAVVIQRN